MQVKRWYTASMLGAKVEGWDAHEVVLYTDAVKMQQQAFVEGYEVGVMDMECGKPLTMSAKDMAARRYKEE